jgi:hypothetical protein
MVPHPANRAKYALNRTRPADSWRYTKMEKKTKKALSAHPLGLQVGATRPKQTKPADSWQAKCGCWGSYPCFEMQHFHICFFWLSCPTYKRISACWHFVILWFINAGVNTTPGQGHTLKSAFSARLAKKNQRAQRSARCYRRNAGRQINESRAVKPKLFYCQSQYTSLVIRSSPGMPHVFSLTSSPSLRSKPELQTWNLKPEF